MKVFNLHVPGTRDTDAEIERLKQELRDKDITLEGVSIYNKKLFDENLDLSRRSQDQSAMLGGQIRMHADRAQALKEENRELRQEVKAYLLAFTVLSSGHDLTQERMLELARQAAQIQQDSHQSCSLSYELYAVQICNEADRILPTLNEQEAKFFQAAFGGDYTPPHERGKDWQSEGEIRHELYREMYGEPHENDNSEEETFSDEEEGEFQGMKI